jgi:hypothetical protein
MNSSQAGFVSGSGLGTNTGRGPHISNNPLPDIGTGSNGNGVANGTVDDTGTGPGTGGGTDPDDNTNTGQGPGSGPGSNRDVTFGEVALNMAAFSFSKDNEIHSRLGGTFDFIPGASGYGLQGNTYASTAMNLSEKRKAVAYGTIVIPGIETTASTVHPYFENSLGIAGLSAGENSVFDVYFNGTMKDSNYCVILTAESEQGYRGGFDPNLPGDIPTEGEFSIVVVRAGSNGDTKTPSFFRIEQYKKDAASGFWGVSPIAMKAGRTERIHFMVFGETSNGTSWLTNPNPVTSLGSISNLDYNVWGLSWFSTSMSDLVNYPSLVSKVDLWSSDGVNYAGYYGNIRPEVGYTGYGINGSVDSYVQAALAIPEGRRVLYPTFYMSSMPPSLYESALYQNSYNTERTQQYFNRHDGYTFTSQKHPTGVTNSTFVWSGVTYYGATFAATRRVMSLYADNQADIISKSLEKLLSDLEERNCSFDYILDDSEAMYPFIPYYISGVGQNYGGTFGRPLLTNQFCSGATVELLYDDFGINAVGSCGAKINALDPEALRQYANDPRNLTYQYSTSGTTTDSSPTVASRFMDLYRQACNYYGITGITATSFTGAIEILYNVGSSMGYAPFPYFASQHTNYQGRTANTWSDQYISNALVQIAYELYHGHYRTIAFRPAIDRGMTYAQYEAAGVSFDDSVFAVDANCNPLLRITPTADRSTISPQFYGGSVGSYDYSYHLINNAGYYPDPQNDVQKYLYNGLTYTQGRAYSAFGTVENGCRRFYPKTALSGPAGSMYGTTGATASNTGTNGATVGFAPSGTTVEIWGGFTARAGDYIWFRQKGTTVYSTPFTVAIGITGATGVKTTVTVLESFAGSGIVAGQTLDIESTVSNGGFLQFVHDLQHLRAILRANPRISTHGMMPWLADSGFGNFAYDSRYWWEFGYHLLLSGANTIAFFSSLKSQNNKLLNNWRNISGNSRCVPITKGKIALNSDVITSGGLLKDGTTRGLYIWRITVRPGSLNETVRLVQSRRQDIPRVLTIPAGNYADHSIEGETSTGTRGIWLITTSSIAPEYKVQT